MLLLLFYDGITAEVPDCEDVIHKPGWLICVDYRGTPIVSLLDKDVLGYTMDPDAVRSFRAIGAEEVSRPTHRPWQG